MPHPTDEQIDAAISKLRKIIDAAENQNHAGEVALMKAANAGQMFAVLDDAAREAGVTDTVTWRSRVHFALRCADPFTDRGAPAEPEPADPETIAAREVA